MLRRNKIVDIFCLISVHRSFICVTGNRNGFIPFRTAINERGKFCVFCHILNGYPSSFRVYLGILGITPNTVDVPVIGRLHKTHGKRSHFFAGDAAFAYSRDLHGVVDGVQRRAVVNELRQVALMEHGIDMWLQTSRTYEIDIASVGGLPQHASGDAAAVFLYALCKVLYRAEHALITERVFCVLFLLSS